MIQTTFPLLQLLLRHLSLISGWYCPPVTCDLLSCTVHCDIAKVFAPEVYIFAIIEEAISHVCFLNILKSLANVDGG